MSRRNLMSPIKRVLVPTDFSVPSDLALDYAVDLAKRLGASVHLLHVIEEPMFAAAYPDGYFAELPTLRVQAIEHAQQRLSECVVRCAPVATTADVQIGRASRVIGEQALARGTDLIVMGTHGRGGVTHLLLGSVAERRVRTAPCPVLTVRNSPRVADALATDAETMQPLCLVTK